MKYIYFNLFLILFLNCQLSFGQQLPLDFSDSLDNFATFGGTSFSVVTDPNVSGNMVGRFINTGGQWEGSYLDLSQPINLAYRNTFTLSFYSSDSNTHNVVLKLEQGTNSVVQLQQDITNPSPNNWVNLTFDFGADAGIGSGSYNRLTIFIDGGNTKSGTYLIDNIDYGSTWTDPNSLDVIYNDLVWSDEFNTGGVNNPVDAANWHHQTLLPGANGEQFNGESQIYTNRLNNSYVENGALNIVAIKENYTDPNQPDYPKTYTSARLNSKFAFTYGRVDVRAKLPSGDGTWPAIWTLGKNIDENGGYWDNQGFGTTSWPACGEIDIMEHGLGDVNHTSSAIHTPSSFGNTVNVASQVISDVANNWHVYSMNWSPNQITFLVDGVSFYTYKPSIKDSNTWPFDLDQYILLNIAMGGYAGTIDPLFTQSSMIIDYVRVYQNNALSTKDKLENAFRVYPNPANTKINISSQLNIDKVELYDITGKLILSTNKPQSNVIDVSAITEGMYLLKIYSGERSSTKKIVIN